MVNVVTLLKRKEGMTRKEFNRYWEKKYGPLVAKQFRGLRRYVQVHPVRLPEVSIEPEFDGVAFLYFDDVQSWHKALSFLTTSDEAEILRDDQLMFVDMSQSVYFVGEEKLIKQGTDKVCAVALLKRKVGITREEFSRHWEKNHGPLVAKEFALSGRYVQVHPAEEHAAYYQVENNKEPDPEIDGVVLVYFDSVQSWQKGYTYLTISEEGKMIRDDHEWFLDMSKTRFVFVGREKVIKNNSLLRPLDFLISL